MSKIKTTILLMFIAIFICNIGYATNSVKYPNPNNKFYVYDETNTIDENTEKIILDINKELKDKTGAQVAVVIINDLQNISIEEYARDLFNKWGVGNRNESNGVLFLIAKDDKKTRIEVGYGLEGAINDGKAGAILDDFVIPEFKHGHYDTGITKGFLAIVKEIQKEYDIKIDNIEKVEEKMKMKEIIMFIVVLLLSIFVLAIATILNDEFSSGGGGFFGGSGGSSGGGGFSGGGGASRGW